MSRVSAPSWAQKGQTRFFQHFTPLLSMLQKHRLALFFNNASCPLKLEATTQRDALLHPLFSSWVTVGSHVTASYVYLAVPRERKQEMLAIAGPLCTLWEIMGGVRRGGDVCPGPCSTSAHRNPIYTLSGREAAFLVIPLITMPLPLYNRTNTVLCKFSGLHLELEQSNLLWEKLVCDMKKESNNVMLISGRWTAP